MMHCTPMTSRGSGTSCTRTGCSRSGWPPTPPFNALHADDLTRFGNLLHKNWLLKKRLAANVSNPLIDQYYARALKAGAVGGKICGSGNGGVLAFSCEERRQNALRQALRPLKETPFSLEEGGSRIVYEED